MADTVEFRARREPEGSSRHYGLRVWSLRAKAPVGPRGKEIRTITNASRCISQLGNANLLEGRGIITNEDFAYLMEWR